MDSEELQQDSNPILGGGSTGALYIVGTLVVSSLIMLVVLLVGTLLLDKNLDNFGEDNAKKVAVGSLALAPVAALVLYKALHSRPRQ